MGIFDFFRPIPAWSAQKVRQYINENDLSLYDIVDVRGAEEYEQEHLPGAKLIPVGELPDRLNELDPDKTTIVY